MSALRRLINDVNSWDAFAVIILNNNARVALTNCDMSFFNMLLTEEIML